jgi:hypothetical protein
MDRALFYGVVVGGVYACCMLVLLNNVPIAVITGGIVGFIALLRGMTVWG